MPTMLQIMAQWIYAFGSNIGIGSQIIACMEVGPGVASLTPSVMGVVEKRVNARQAYVFIFVEVPPAIEQRVRLAAEMKALLDIVFCCGEGGPAAVGWRCR